MHADTFDGLPAFLVVGRLKSFTRAGAELGVTPTAVSQTVKALERRLGVVLFQRTTRSVAFTDAGAALFARLGPAVTDVEEALTGLGDRPMGTLRITAPRFSGITLLPLIRALREAHPDLSIDLSFDNAFVDLVSAGFDVGVRLGDAVAKDMIRVPLTRETRWSIVGAPSYFERRGRPRTPEDLTKHQAIGFRLTTRGVVYRWELTRDGRDVVVDVDSPILVNDLEMQVVLAREGLGLTYAPDEVVAGDISAKRLERVLTNYMTPGVGAYLYFPERMQTQPKIRALVDLAAKRFAKRR